MGIRFHGWSWVLLILLGAASIGGAQAQVAIGQTTALAGNVTPDDTAGFPVTITRPGSYRLTSNLQVPAGVDGIVAAATEVTIDLNGFRIDGGGVARTGIVGQQRNLTVRNVTVRKFAAFGIDNNGAGLLVDLMRVQENGGIGVYNSGANSAYGEVRASSILGNGFKGVDCGRGCVVRDSFISQNGAIGVEVRATTAIVVGSTIVSNREWGVIGGGGVLIDRNVFGGNGAGNIFGTVSQGTNVCGAASC